MIIEQLTSALRSAAESEGLTPPDSIGMEQPANREHGDWSSNLALATSKQAGTNPRELAERLITRLEAQNLEHVDRMEVAGPGFINFHLESSWLHDVLRLVVAEGTDKYGRNHLGAGRHVNVEFVSANPTGPLHAGHGRGAVYGDALASLLAWCGYEVTRETYVNDRGVQMQTYAASLAARAAGESPPDDGYIGQYIIDWAAEMPADADPLEWGYARALADQQEVLASLGIVFDRWSSEKALVENGALERALERLTERGVVYEHEDAVWFRSTDFGDDKDRVLVKSDGQYTYLTPDIAYHADKFDRSDELVDVLGADHHGYIGRMKAAMAALGHDSEDLDIRILQLVKLMRGDQEVRLSKRSGDIVELRDVVDEVGADATRFTYLLQSIDSQQTFDLAAAAAQGMDNPVFYTQMAHARIVNIAKRAQGAGFDRGSLGQADLSLLTHEREIELLRALFSGPGLIEVAGRERAPHRVVGWVRELAGDFHSFYQNDDCYVVGDNVAPELTVARLWLLEAVRIGLVTGLTLVGVSAPDAMWHDEADSEEE